GRRSTSSGESAGSTRSSSLGPPLETELLLVLGVQALPAVELHGLGADDAADGMAGDQPVQRVQADVPARGAHRDEVLVDVVPERQARAAAGGRELPLDVLAAPVVLEYAGGVRPRHSCFRYHRRADL